MIYQAKVENGIVTDVIVASESFTNFLEGTWISCTEDTLPGVGYTYTPEEGFRPIKPFSSWIWNEISKEWVSPIPMPDDINIYEWNEYIQSWKMIYLKVE